MFTPFKTLAIVSMLALAQPALSQEAEAPAPPAGADTAPDGGGAPEAPADSGPIGLDLGEPVEQAPGIGDPYIREAFGDWALRCLRAPEGEADPCQLYQLLRDQDDNPVAEVSIVPLPPGSDAAAGAVVVVPLETQLTERLILSIDGGEARRYEFDFCNRAGCVARFGLSAAQLDQFRRGAEGQLRIVPALAPDQEVLLRMSLMGITAGLNATNATAPE